MLHDCDYEATASQVLRAMRGKRSQVALSRRLGYKGNPITDWENGNRYPSIEETLRVARTTRTDHVPAFEALLAKGAPLASCVKKGTQVEIAGWLKELQGSTSIADLARIMKRSRYSVSRWLSGTTELRLPHFLKLVDVLTGRLHDWVGALVDIALVPALTARHERASAARRLAEDQPWSEVILRVIETSDCRKAEDPSSYCAALLGLDEEEVSSLIDSLVHVGVLKRDESGLSVQAALTVATSGVPQDRNALRRHWSAVAHQRLSAHPDTDWFAYNAIAVSREDSKRIEQRLRAAYREVRSIVAQSEPSEVAALLTVHLVRWEP